MSGVLVLDNATVIPATGTPPFLGSVVVENGLIAEVIDGPLRRIGDATLIDLGGRALLPGLIDAHVHVTAVDADIQSQAHRRFESEIAVLAGIELTNMLERGFTTVRDAGGADAGFRRAIGEGSLVGPRLLVSGRALSQTGGHGDHKRATEEGELASSQPRVGQLSIVADGPDQVRLCAREQLRRGADQVKVMASGGVMSPTDRLRSVQYSLEELTAAVQVADSVGTYVMAHAYTPAAISQCVAAGVRSIEHGNLLDWPTAQLMAEHGTFLVPTLVTYEKLHDEGSRHGIGSEHLDKLAEVIDAGLESLRMARDAGVPIASGSDLLGPMRRFQGEEIAIKARVLGSLGAIVAATRTNAELLSLDAAIGTIEADKRADLVVVDGDVLDSPSLIGRAEHVSLVLKEGRIVVNHLG